MKCLSEGKNGSEHEVQVVMNPNPGYPIIGMIGQS